MRYIINHSKRPTLFANIDKYIQLYKITYSVIVWKFTSRGLIKWGEEFQKMIQNTEQNTVSRKIRKEKIHTNIIYNFWVNACSS